MGRPAPLAPRVDNYIIRTASGSLRKPARVFNECHHVRHRSADESRLDTLDAAKFRTVTRWGDLDKVLEGIKAAQDAGIAVKINVVALKGVNEDEFVALVKWAHGAGMDLTFIEVMPLGDVGEGRLDQYLPLSMVRARIA